MQYAICQIKGKQYLVEPGKIIEVDKLGVNDKRLKVPEVLLTVNNGKITIGNPYLKTTLDFEILGDIKKPKIRVATYHAKANYRRVKGSRAQVTKIKMLEIKGGK